MGAKNNLWTEQRVQYLRDNYRSEFTRDIVKALGGVFTRNAVIGKAQRLGLQADFRLGPRREKSGEIVVKKIKVSPRGKPIATRRDNPMEEIRTKRLHKPVPFMELESWHCREIIKDNPTMCCGMQRLEGSSYCPEHHRKNHVNVSQHRVEKYYGL
jgi:hypothetical protein